MGVTLPFGAQDGVQAFVVNGLFLSRRMESINSINSPLKTAAASPTLFPRLVVGHGRRLGPFEHGLDLARLLVDAVRIEG